MNSDDLLEQDGSEPNEPKQPWLRPIIEYVNLASSESNLGGGGTTDGFNNSTLS